MRGMHQQQLEKVQSEYIHCQECQSEYSFFLYVMFRILLPKTFAFYTPLAKNKVEYKVFLPVLTHYFYLFFICF